MGITDSLERIENLQGTLEHRFANRELLERALTHRSFTHEDPRVKNNNERLEFLGDAVLDLVISHMLMDHFPDRWEGELSKLRASIVNEATLARLARELELGTALLLGKGEERSGGRAKDSLLADAYEAVVGAIYLDAGFDVAQRIVREQFSALLAELEDPTFNRDYKTRLQEWTQSHHKAIPVYELVGETGPDHEKTFEVVLSFGGTVRGRGTGKSKKEAEQNAARVALEQAATQTERPRS